MVTFNNAGRFGNWFLECAAMLAYALKHNLDFTVPAQTNNPKYNPIYCFHLINPNYNPNLETIRLWENGHIWQPLEFKEEWRGKNIVIEGYRQSEKYFKEYRREILYLMNFPYKKKEGCVGIHVRRGDYLYLLDKHPTVTKQWYEEAMNLFPGYKFRFYSDELDWCRSEFDNRADCEFFNGDEVSDVSDGSGCEHNIISSSTFGWAMAWLNRNPEKKIIIPKLWFVENYSLDTTDIVPSEWIKL